MHLETEGKMLTPRFWLLNASQPVLKSPGRKLHCAGRGKAFSGNLLNGPPACVTDGVQSRKCHIKTSQSFQGLLGLHTAERDGRHSAHSRIFAGVHPFRDVAQPFLELANELGFAFAIVKQPESPDRSRTGFLADEGFIAYRAPIPGDLRSKRRFRGLICALPHELDQLR